MEPLEIMTKVLNKAKANGWNFPTGLSSEAEARMILSQGMIKGILFSHDLAKAFWGEEGFTLSSSSGQSLNNWQYHLQQMVLEKEPLKYMEKFLDE